jgi:signal transduction histidine kinase
MGLGLYIVHKLVNRLQGTIKLVSSRPGHTEIEMQFSKGGNNAR